jgi:hypothetical protein
MKNLYTKKQFIVSINEQPLNEGLWSWIRKGIKAKRGAKLIDDLVAKYNQEIDKAFNSLQNVEAPKMASKEFANYKYPTEGIIMEASFGFGKSNDEPEAFDPDSPETATKNTEEVKDLVNLKPEQIKTLTEQVKKRISDLGNRFIEEVNGVIAKLNKDPKYSSEGLKEYAKTKRYEMMDRIYQKWYEFYKKIGNTEKIKEVNKIKVNNQIELKKSITELQNQIKSETDAADKEQKQKDELSSKESDEEFRKSTEEEAVPKIKKGAKYLYNSKTYDKDINVFVVSSKLGVDENGQKDDAHSKHVRVKSDDEKYFWVIPSDLQSIAIP